jgi:Mg-chelatase subunit ChlD
VLASGGLLALAGAFGYGITGRSTPEPALPIPIEGTRTLPIPILAGLALDESGSTRTSDPERASHRATLIVARWLVEHSQDLGDRVGVVRFADSTTTIEPAPLATGIDKLAQALAKDANIGGGTRLGPAVDALCRVLESSSGERKVAFLVTDGAVNEGDAEVRSLIGLLRTCADAVYLVALDHDGEWTRSTHVRYASLGLTGEIVVGKLEGDALAVAIAKALVNEAGLATR